jgi:cystathionine beta-lyase/cystathionine gamma-synthase
MAGHAPGDRTFATPLNQRPADFGIDLVWHSATKYLNGHSDVSAGVLAGPAEILDRIWDVALLTGATLGPIDAWLLLRGMRTLPLRVPRHNANGQALAEALKDHPAVSRVYYPGLATHPQHKLAIGRTSGFGGVLGIEKVCERAEKAPRRPARGLGDAPHAPFRTALHGVPRLNQPHSSPSCPGFVPGS